MAIKGTYSGIIASATIKKGIRGSNVKELQKFLNWYGNYKLVVDGICGPKTVTAIKAFQKSESLTVDGIYGPKSYAKAKAYAKPKAMTKAEKIVAKANELAWPYGTASSKWSYSKGSPTAKCKSAMKKYGYDTKSKMSDCGRFATTVVRESGVDKDFVAMKGVKSAFPTSNKFSIVLKGKAIPSGFLKAGDIVRYKKTSGQHTLIYMGNGRVAEARHYHRFGNIYKDEKRYNGSNVKKSTIQVLRAK